MGGVLLDPYRLDGTQVWTQQEFGVCFPFLLINNLVDDSYGPGGSPWMGASYLFVRQTDRLSPTTVCSRGRDDSDIRVRGRYPLRQHAHSIPIRVHRWHSAPGLTGSAQHGQLKLRLVTGSSSEPALAQHGGLTMR